MKQLDIYLKEWDKSVSEAKEMLKEGNVHAYEMKMQEAEEKSKEYQSAKERVYECNNYGTSSYIFEGMLPELLKKDKKVIRKFMTTIKEDKNLMGEFAFFKALEKYNSNLDAKEYVNEALEMAREKVDSKTLNESNSKLAKIIKNYELIPEEKISEERMAFFDACNFILENKKGLFNLNKYNTNLKVVTDFITKNYNTMVTENKENIYAIMESFNKKYANLLNEEEKNFVQEIIDCTSEVRSQKKEALFEKFKNECIKEIDRIIDEGVGEAEKAGLEGIRQQVENKFYNEATSVQDFAKMLEIRDVLMER